MNWILERLKNEPVLTLTLLALILNTSVAFGLDGREGQIMLLPGLFAAVVSGIIRQQVTPVQ